MSGNLSNSYGKFLSGYQNPKCAVIGPQGISGIPGTNGATGSTGSTGPTGAPGRDGLTTGQIYYFYTEQLTGGPTWPPQPNVNKNNDAGFLLKTVPGAGPGLPPGNPNPTYAPYNGYLAYMNQAGYLANGGSPSTPSNLAAFHLPLTGKTTIPAGYWTFINNIYSYDTSNPTTTRPVNIHILISLWNTALSTSTVIGGDLVRTFAINNPLSADDTPYTMPVLINTTQIISNPATDFVIVEFFIEKNYAMSSGQVIELWSEGNSISEAITTFSPQSGPTGPIGLTGPSGKTGSTGPINNGGYIEIIWNRGGTPISFTIPCTNGVSMNLQDIYPFRLGTAIQGVAFGPTEFIGVLVPPKTQFILTDLPATNYNISNATNQPKFYYNPAQTNASGLTPGLNMLPSGFGYSTGSANVFVSVNNL